MLRPVTTHRLITMFMSILLQRETYIGKPNNIKEPVGIGRLFSSDSIITKIISFQSCGSGILPLSSTLPKQQMVMPDEALMVTSASLRARLRENR